MDRRCAYFVERFFVVSDSATWRVVCRTAHCCRTIEGNLVGNWTQMRGAVQIDIKLERPFSRTRMGARQNGRWPVSRLVQIWRHEFSHPPFKFPSKCVRCLPLQIHKNSQSPTHTHARSHTYAHTSQVTTNRGSTSRGRVGGDGPVYYDRNGPVFD